MRLRPELILKHRIGTQDPKPSVKSGVPPPELEVSEVLKRFLEEIEAVFQPCMGPPNPFKRLPQFLLQSRHER